LTAVHRAPDGIPRRTGGAPPPTPIYWIAPGLLLGQLAGTALAWLPAVAAVTAALVLMLAWRRRWAHGAMAGLALAAAASGAWQAGAARRESPADVVRLAGARAWIRAAVAERPVRQPGRMRLVLAVTAARRGPDWAPATGRLLVTLTEATQPWQRGDALEAVLDLRTPRNFGNPGEFDYEAFLARRGIRATAFARDDAGWRRDAAPASGPAAALERWRAATARTLAATLDGRDAPVAAALLIGELGALDEAVRARYARAGVSHILSISGLHVGLVAAAVAAAARWLLSRSDTLLLATSVPKLAVLASLPAVALYAAIAGANLATLRAELMALLVAAALLLDRPRDWLAPLAVAAAALALAQPGAGAEISFQLSFVAVLAILLGVPRLTARWNAWEEARLLRLRGWHWRALRWLVLAQAVTVCAALGTAPLTAWHFNQVSLVAPFANLVVVPLLGVVTVGLGLLGTVAVALAPPLAPWLFAPVGLAVRLADLAVAWCAALPWAAVRTPTPSLLELGLLYGILGGLLLDRRLWRRGVVACCAGALAIDAAAWAVERHAGGTLRLTFVSVGQGDCTVIEFPGSQVMVVDGGGLQGGRFDVGERVVAPLLWRRKILRVDALALSHPDFDHYGGLTFLAAAFAPRHLWWNGAAADGAGFAALRRALAATGAPLVHPPVGAEFVIDGVSMRILHPTADDVGPDNDRSLTLQLRYGPTTVLLPGDLEAGGEAALVGRWGKALRSTVLKVPHHGSRTSSSPPFLDAVAPRIAVASAGAANRFGFPHASVVETYAARGVALWRTDRDGAVRVTITRAGAVAVAGTREARP